MRDTFSDHTTKRIAAYLLFFITILVYIPSVTGDFIWDDESYIKYNSLLITPTGLWQIWFDLKANAQYYPLTFSTFWLEFQLWGLWPAGYHVVNILLHGMNAILLWMLFSRLAIPGAWLAAAVFALHPIHVDSVAQISERKNVLSMVFYLLALLNYIRFSHLDQSSEDSSQRSWKQYSLVLLFLICALFSKTTACSLPAVMLLLLWWKKKRIDWKYDLFPLFPLFVVSLFMSILTVIVEQEVTGATGGHWERSFSEKFLIAGRAFWIYVGNLFWPFDLRFMYPKWEVTLSTYWQYVFPISCLVALASAFLFRGRIGKSPAIAIFCFAGNLLPALGFFNLYFMRYSFIADHFQYLASVSLIALAIGILWHDLDDLYAKAQQTHSRQGALFKYFCLAAPYRSVFSCIVLLSLGVLSWKHEYIYANRETVWTETLKKDSTSLVAHNNLGNIFLERNEYDRALSHYQAVINREPNFPEAQYNLALTLVRLGRVGEAIPHGMQAVQLRPDVSLFHSLLGTALWTNGDIASAVEHFRQATQLHPTVPQAHYNLGLLYLLASATLPVVHPQEAIDQFERALSLNPHSLQTQHTLAWILATFPDATIRNGKRAVQLAAQACQRTKYQIPQLLDTLAAAYATNGQFPEAIQTAQAAANEARDQQQDTLANQITMRLDLYKANKPYHGSIEQLRTFKMAS